MTIDLKKINKNINICNINVLSRYKDILEIYDDYVKLHVDDYILNKNINVPNDAETIYWLSYNGDIIHCTFNKVVYNDKLNYMRLKKIVSEEDIKYIEYQIENFKFFKSNLTVDIEKDNIKYKSQHLMGLGDFLSSERYSRSLDEIKRLKIRKSDNFFETNINQTVHCDCCGSSFPYVNQHNTTISYREQYDKWNELKGEMEKWNRTVNKNLVLCSVECVSESKKLMAY